MEQHGNTRQYSTFPGISSQSLLESGTEIVHNQSEAFPVITLASHPEAQIGDSGLEGGTP
jgi:hypothetical protein